MNGIEVALIGLGTAVAKAACGVWLGDHRIAAAAGTSVIDLAAQRLTGAREQRQFRRLWDQAAELVADRVEPLLAHEFRGLPEHERLATVAAVQSTFDAAALTDADLFAHDLDAGFLHRHLRGQDPGRITVAGLSARAAPLYDLLLRESCAYAIELARTLPGAGVTALTEVLRRERQLLDDMRTVLERLPARRGRMDFARDYLQLVAGVLDQVEFFGATVTVASRRYPLSVAYLSLTVSGEFLLRRRDEQMSVLEDLFASAPPATITARVEDVLDSTGRLFVRGEAGSGKTTLLQWFAVQCARGRSPYPVPFYIALRRHADGELPTPERFVDEVGRHIAAEMPDGWVHELLRSGRAVVLIDGVDELAEARREEARQWLRELVAAFPTAQYVVTSRPAAVPADWLGRDDFDVADLEPMSTADIPVFVHRWHEAMREQCDTDAERAELTEYEEQLRGALTTQRHLRSLARSPLLCALLCALHRDRHGQLPGNRMELYEVALQMLLERRDRERRIDREVALTRTDQMLLLRHIAYWLIRNGWSSASAERVRERIADKLAGMAQIGASAEAVYRVLVERSGLLREPAAGHTDFVHRTFQEYLAAAEAVATDDIGSLVANAYTDLWSDVVVMAAGHATPAQRTELIRGLLDRADREPDPRLRRLADSLRLLAAACLETSPEVPPELRREVQRTTEALLPPKTMTTAHVLAKSGRFTLDLLARTTPRTAAETAATIRAAADIGDPAALPLLARFGKDSRKSVVRELLRAWHRFDPEEYARTVLPHHPLEAEMTFEIRDPSLIPGLRHLSNLRLLRIITPDGRAVDPAFIADLPALRDLVLSDVTDLRPLAGTAITHFAQPMGGLIDRPPLSLAPLSEMPDLRDLMIWGRTLADISALRAHDGLDHLFLGELGSRGALAEVPPLPKLEALGIGGMPDLESLTGIPCLTCPRRLFVQSCAGLADVSVLARLDKTLSWVGFHGCPAVDLTPLGALRCLELLSLRDSGPLELAPIAGLPRLRRIELGYGPLPDLRPLRDSPALAALAARGVLEIDLDPLRGREGLTVEVDRSATVHGADRLGPGSRIVRR